MINGTKVRPRAPSKTVVKCPRFQTPQNWSEKFSKKPINARSNKRASINGKGTEAVHPSLHRLSTGNGIWFRATANRIGCRAVTKTSQCTRSFFVISYSCHERRRTMRKRKYQRKAKNKRNAKPGTGERTDTLKRRSARNACLRRWGDKRGRSQWGGGNRCC